MRLTELMRMPTEHLNGTSFGGVKDLRLERRNDDWVITHIVVGRGALAERLGFIHGVVERPALLARLMRRLGRRARVVPWDDVQVENGVVRISGSPDQFGRPEGYR